MARKTRRSTGFVPRMIFTMCAAGVVPTIAVACGSTSSGGGGTNGTGGSGNTGNWATGAGGVAVGGYGGFPTTTSGSGGTGNWAAVGSGGFSVAMGGFGGTGGTGGTGSGASGGSGGAGGMPPDGGDMGLLDPTEIDPGARDHDDGAPRALPVRRSTAAAAGALGRDKHALRATPQGKKRSRSSRA
jgi:hypothetical protein